MTSTVLVTGGAGFIGSNFVRHLLRADDSVSIVTLDRLTYAGSLGNLADLPDPDRHEFALGDIADGGLVRELLATRRVASIVHFAAESHVDRSIDGPAEFIQTNVVGTFNLLEAAREVWQGRFDQCRFVHVSTDEVYGSLSETDPPFRESTPYAPNSPYAASKASADHLVRAYFETYRFPAVTTNCSNNYGPYQYPEKLIPLIIIHGLTGKPLPVYGDGRQIRDWLYVEDHCQAVARVLARGRLGQTYNIGGLNEQRNIDIVQRICDLLDELRPLPSGESYRRQITHVTDRPGHDRRYAIDASKIQDELDWTPRESFDTGLRKTVAWYLEHESWVNDVMRENYDDWMAINYSERKEIST